MIRTTDLVGASTARLPVIQPVWTLESRHSAAWFEPDHGGMTIHGDVDTRARGLSVQDHVERVLVHLRVERDVPV